MTCQNVDMTCQNVEFMCQNVEFTNKNVDLTCQNVKNLKTKNSKNNIHIFVVGYHQ